MLQTKRLLLCQQQVFYFISCAKIDLFVESPALDFERASNPSPHRRTQTHTRRHLATCGFGSDAVRSCILISWIICRNLIICIRHSISAPGDGEQKSRLIRPLPVTFDCIFIPHPTTISAIERAVHNACKRARWHPRKNDECESKSAKQSFLQTLGSSGSPFVSFASPASTRACRCLVAFSILAPRYSTSSFHSFCLLHRVGFVLIDVCITY